MVPISIRQPAERGTFTNRVTGTLVPLHTNLEDPVDRLRAIHESMAAAKELQEAIPATILTDVTQFMPPALAAQATRLSARIRIADRMNPPINLTISNVPGPRVPLYLGGAAMEHFYPVSVVAEGQGLNMTVQSYLDNLDFGLIADRELVPDLWDLCAGLETSMDELLAAARQTRTVSAAPTTRAVGTGGRAPGASERPPLALGLGEPIADGPRAAGVEAQPGMGAADLDVLAGGAGLVDARVPADHPVGAGVDRGRRHGHRISFVLTLVAARERIDARREPLVQAVGAAAVLITQPERAAERDHLAHQLRVGPGQLPCVDPTQAPADHAHRSTPLMVERDEAPLDSPHDARVGSDVGAEPPAADRIALGAQHRAEEPGGLVGGREARQGEHRVAVALSGEGEQRQARDRVRGLDGGEGLEPAQRPRWWQERRGAHGDPTVCRSPDGERSAVDLALTAVPVGLPQLAFEHLARRVARELGHDGH